MDDTKRGRGRPTMAAAQRRRHNQTFRCNDDLRARLQVAAEQNQRSVSEEVERRLEASLQASSATQHGLTAADVRAIVRDELVTKGAVGATMCIEPSRIKLPAADLVGLRLKLADIAKAHTGLPT